MGFSRAFRGFSEALRRLITHFRQLNCGNYANPIAVSEKFKIVLAFPQSNGIVRIDKRRALL